MAGKQLLVLLCLAVWFRTHLRHVVALQNAQLTLLLLVLRPAAVVSLALR